MALDIDCCMSRSSSKVNININQDTDIHCPKFTQAGHCHFNIYICLQVNSLYLFTWTRIPSNFKANGPRLYLGCSGQFTSAMRIPCIAEYIEASFSKPPGALTQQGCCFNLVYPRWDRTDICSTRGSCSPFQTLIYFSFWKYNVVNYPSKP